MRGAGDGSLQCLLDLFPETLVEIAVPQAGGGELSCGVFDLGEMAALAATLRLGGWQADERHRDAPERAFPPTFSFGCLNDPRDPPTDGVPESVTDFS